MNNFKQIITKLSISTVMMTIALSNVQVEANSYPKKSCSYNPTNNRTVCHTKSCSYDPTNNRTFCHTSGSSTTRTSIQRTTRSTRTNTNFNVNISPRNAESLVNDVLNKKVKSSPTNNRRQYNFPNFRF